MRKHLLLGFKTNSQQELGQIVYFGGDTELLQKAFDETKFYRYQFFQLARPIKQKFKEENLQKVSAEKPAKPEEKSGQEQLHEALAELDVESKKKPAPKAATKVAVKKVAAKKVAAKKVARTAEKLLD